METQTFVEIIIVACKNGYIVRPKIPYGGADNISDFEIYTDKDKLKDAVIAKIDSLSYSQKEQS